MIISFRNIRIKSKKIIIKDSSIKSQLIKLMIILFCILVMHTWAMMRFEGMSLIDALWLTMTSATTVGYGDLSAQTVEGRMATIILLYIAGIAILAQVAAMYFEYRQEVRNNILKGRWRWNMDDHIVFLNCPDEAGQEYYYQAISQLRESNSELSTLPIVIVSDNLKDGIDDKIRKLNVVHVSQSPTEDDALEAANAMEARAIIILCKKHLDASSDSINFEVIDRLREKGFKRRIISEAVRDENRRRLIKAGANNVLRPIRTYPELLIRSLLAPGAEQIIENIFDSYGEECVRFDVEVSSNWSDIVNAMVCEEIGTPLAYEDTEGKIVTNEKPNKKVSTKAIFAVVSHEDIMEDSSVQSLLDNKLRA